MTCQHEAAVAAVGEALALAERQRERGRRPADRSLHRPWLYALARWACLRRLAEDTDRAVVRPERMAAEAPTEEQHRELSTLAWPQAAGTTPEQREALELAVRHQLPAVEVAAVIGTDLEATHTLLSRAACEVERTRAALAVVGSGGCATIARLGLDDEVLLTPALRQELVRHVDECGGCRRSAERVMADAPWPGTAPTGSAVLPLLGAPRLAVHAAMGTAHRSRFQHTPRFDRRGFPVDTRDRAVRIARLRSRAVTVAVVVAVLAVPVLATWTAYQAGTAGDSGAPTTGRPGDRGDTPPYEGTAFGDAGAPAAQGSSRPPGSARDGSGVAALDGRQDGPDPTDPLELRVVRGSGPLTVRARPYQDGTVLTLGTAGGVRVSGRVPFAWSARTSAGWLRLSRTQGALRSGETTRILVTVDPAREPLGPWSARIQLSPAAGVVTVRGNGAGAEPSAERSSVSAPAHGPSPSTNPAPSGPLPTEEPPEPSGGPVPGSSQAPTPGSP